MRNLGALLAVGLVALGTACANPAASATSPAPASNAVAATPASANPAPAVNGSLGGTVQSLEGARVVLLGGAQFDLGSDALVIRSVPTDPTALQPGDFVAVTAARQPDGTLLASVVNIFPESMRGLGIGQRPMTEGNLMTNATIDELMTNATIDAATPQMFSVSFPGGSDQVKLADDAQVSQFQAAEPRDLVPGVSITARVADGSAQFVTILM